MKANFIDGVNGNWAINPSTIEEEVKNGRKPIRTDQQKRMALIWGESSKDILEIRWSINFNIPSNNEIVGQYTFFASSFLRIVDAKAKETDVKMIVSDSFDRAIGNLKTYEESKYFIEPSGLSPEMIDEYSIELTNMVESN